MKKVIVLFICANILLLNSSFAFVNVLEDNLVNALDKDLKIEKQNKTYIQDDFVLRTLDPNLKIENKKSEIVEDKLEKELKNKKITRKIENNKVTFVTGDTTKIKITPVKYYTTRTNLFEGEYIDFALVEDIKIKNKIYKANSIVKARVENVSPNGAYGIPADVVIGNFILEDKTKLDGEISLQGANRSLWVYPIGHFLTLCLGVGVLIYPIRGGHAKFKINKIYEFEAFE